MRNMYVITFLLLFLNYLNANEYLADIAAKDVQKLLDNNGGSIKVAPATYMDRVFKYESNVAIYFTYKSNELIQHLMNKNINFVEATNIINSKAFLDSVDLNQKNAWLNNYCNTKPISEFIDKGVVLIVGIYWDDRTPIINNFKIDKNKCKMYFK